MNLEPNQIAAITQWYAEGASLSDLQKRIKTEFDLTLTYLEVRLLAEELKLTREEAEREPSPTLETTILPPDSSSAPGTGKVSVSVSAVQRPGTLLSGQVTFSDGQSAEWFLDQMGRLGLNPSQPGYRPSKNDVSAFQTELEKIARNQAL